MPKTPNDARAKRGTRVAGLMLFGPRVDLGRIDRILLVSPPALIASRRSTAWAA